MIADIERAAHLIGRHLERELAPVGLTQAEAHVLARLGRGEAASPAELHRLFGHRRSTVTGVLDRLEARGLVERQPHAHDRRSLLVSLTPAGRKAAAAVVAAVETLERRIGERAGSASAEGFAATIAAVDEVAGS